MQLSQSSATSMDDYMIQPGEAPSALPWPEAPLATPRREETFPVLPVALWLLPGIVGAIVLVLLLTQMEQRAGRLILFRSPSGQLATIRADGTNQRLIRLTGLASANFGIPQWSPDGGRYAAVANQGRLVIAQPQVITPTVIAVSSGNVELPGRAWSPTGDFVALLGSMQANGRSLVIADVARKQAVPVALDLARDTPLAWHPAQNKLLVTARLGNRTQLLLVDSNGETSQFTPKDELASRSFGAWSPDGAWIAYVANPDQVLFGGSLWIARSDGSEARALVAEGQNFAPIWTPAGDALLFTRLVTETNEHELYRVTLEGQNVAKIGRGTPALAEPTIDPHTVVDWAPDGKLFFQAADLQQQRVVVYVSEQADGQNPTPVFIENSVSNLAVRWSPTSRSLLIGSPSRGMLLQWLDREGTATRFMDGSEPSWQPEP